MIAAIREMAEKKEELRETHLLTAEYLQACNLLFENEILSHEKITSVSSKALLNMAEGMKWFMKWKEELQDKPGHFQSIIMLINILLILYRSQIQK